MHSHSIPQVQSYPYHDDVRDDLLLMIPPDGKRIGSIGCGTAATEAVLVQRGREVHGVDVSSDAIRLASQRLTSARVIAATDLAPFELESLDGLILADVLEHIPAAWDALTAYARAVRPGGWVVISVPNMRHIEPMYHFLVLGDWPEQTMGVFDATHLQIMSRKRLARWCARAGLTVEKWFTRYDPRGPRRRWFFRAVDMLTLGLFRSWLMFQIQCVCRKSHVNRRDGI